MVSGVYFLIYTENQIKKIMMKININKVHGGLVNNFEEVKISEKSNKELGNYFEVSALKESKEVKMIITKKNIENDRFSWSYYSDPSDESSYLIERISTTETIVSDVSDIIEKNRFSEDYLLKIGK
jgi:hypothetical protein